MDTKAFFAGLAATYAQLTPEQQAAMAAQVALKRIDEPWTPNPGPQTECVLSKADITLYGGQGGGGKSDCLLGLAMTKHRRSLIMRRQYKNLAALTDRAIKVNGTRDGFREAPYPRFVTKQGRLIEFGAAQFAGDEEGFQGQPHDFIGFDEVTQMLESQVRFLMGWLRSTDEGQRCRVVMATNPPIDANGDWVTQFFAPWLDLNYHNPAKPGELRWCMTDEDGKDRWVDGPEPVDIDGKTYIPHSRTFIPAALKDNPYLADTGYQAQLDALPEPLRSAVRDGNFMAARKDDDAQVIPSEWVRAAQARWTPDPPQEAPMCAIGIDPAKGGSDETVLARRYDAWYDRLIVVPGRETPEGKDTAALAIINRRHNAALVIDVGGGYGDAAYEILKANLEQPMLDGTKPLNKVVYKFDGSESSTGRTVGKTMPFFNKRAEAWWRFREALDPGQEGGSKVCLPPDPKLLSDLTSPCLDKNVLARGEIKIEGKPELKKRLGRSPDRGDAVVMAWAEGGKAMTHATIWKPYRESNGTAGRRPQAVDPYANRRR